MSQRTGALSTWKASLLGISTWHHTSSRTGQSLSKSAASPSTNLVPTEGFGQLFLPCLCYWPAAKTGAQAKGSFPGVSLSRSQPLSLSFCHICYTCGMIWFHRPRHTWGSAHLSTGCVCSQNRKSVIPSSILTNKAWSKFMTLNPKLGEESHSFWKVPRRLLIPYDSDFESLFWKQSWAHRHVCLLSAYSSQVSGSKGSTQGSTSPLQGPHTTRKAMG